MPERKFLIKENQEIWDTYYMKNLQVWDSENKDKLGAIQWTEEEKITKGKKLMAYHMPIEKITPYSYEYIRKKQSIQQYKPVILRFENYTKKSFNAASAEDIEKFRRVEKKINHFIIGSEKFPELNRVLNEVGAAHGISAAAAAIAWLLRHPAGIQPVVGTMNPDHLRDLAAAGDVTLSREEWYAIYMAAGNQLP